MAIELGNITLTQLSQISVQEQARIVRHPVPGMSGDLSQTLGRTSVVIRFHGVFYGPNATEELGGLRSAYLEQRPVDFFTEATGEGYFTQVLITRLDIQQRANYPDEFDYLCELVEYVEPPEPVVASPLALDAVDADLLGEAASFVDDVQNALDEVSGLVDLLAGATSFGDPTSKLPEMLEEYTSVTGEVITSLTRIRDIFS